MSWRVYTVVRGKLNQLRMTIKIGNEILRIETVNHDYWRPNELSKNKSQILIDNDWYECGLNFVKENNKNAVEILDPYLENKSTKEIEKFHSSGIYRRIEISFLKKKMINYLLNRPSIRYRFTYLKNKLSERINVIIIFLIALILSALFFMYNNNNNNNELIDFISKNLWCQTIIMFLTISSFINIFYPFALRKEINRRDIKDISSETTDSKFKEREQENERKKSAMI